MTTAVVILLMIPALLAALSMSASHQLLCSSSLPGWLGAADIPMIILLILPLILVIKGRDKGQGRYTHQRSKRTKLKPALFISASLLAIINIALFIYTFAAQPHGDWDAWAIWNLHARFIFRGGADWHAYLSPVLNWSHPDYPLMLPAGIARFWQVTGRETALAPILISFSFTAITVLLLFSSLQAVRAGLSSVLAATVLLGTPAFIVLGADQYADVPISFFYLATLVLLTLRQTNNNKRACLFAAFTMAGCAAWTKNEGMMFLIIAALAHLGVTAKHHGKKECISDALVVMCAAMPFLALILTLKSLAPNNDLISGLNTLSLSERLLDFNRYLEILRAGLLNLITFNNGLGIITLTALCIFGKKAIHPNPATQTGLLILGMMIAAFFCVFLLTPHDLTWHLDTALERLIIQLWPATIFVGFLSFDIEPTEDIPAV